MTDYAPPQLACTQRTLRDEFAMAALQVLMDCCEGDYEWAARNAYFAADAMMKERDK